MITLKDVAAAAGVSPATVSRTLNHKNVAPELAERVRAAVAELGYRPNAVARNLRRRDTRVWALVIPDLANPFFTALARGVEDVAAAHGYSLLLCNTDENAEKEQHYLEVVEAERVAGLVIAPISDRTDVSRLTDSGIRVVAVDRPLPGGFDHIGSDSRAGARTATEHLFDQGWGRVAILTGPDDSHTAWERVAGYRDAATSRGLEPVVVHAPYTVAGGREGGGALLGRSPRPDAVLAANSMLGLGLLEVAREAGLVIGADLGLVVFDDSTWAPLLDPPLTVIAQDAYGIGARAARLLVDRLTGREPARAQIVRFPTDMIERLSSHRR